ncbi:hypothetical protein [Stenotrophomonas lacuserhaii]|uniref:hypothetical protein n=1 Tax=Stenotrophomonas lacuserhaii TaxID=2760084 RepID=UPI0032ED7D12
MDSLALVAYRQYLDGNNDIRGRTRQQSYSTATAFFRELQQAGLAPAGDLPAGFANVEAKPKPTFAESVRDWHEVRELDVYKGWLAETVGATQLTESSRHVLGACRGWMATLEKQASEVVELQLADWALADFVIEEGSRGALNWNENRSVEAAIHELHLAYGRFLPRSDLWPSGIVDHCKYRGWPPSRLKSALFPTVKSLDALLVLCLANRHLAPNVDSVAFYAWIDCIVPAEWPGQVRVKLGKFRGTGPSALLSDRSTLVQGLRGLGRLVTHALKERPGLASSIQDAGRTPLFLHHFNARGADVVRRLDPSTTSDMVRRFISKAAETEAVLRPLVGKVTGEQFRGTHLLCDRLEGKSIFTIQSVAKHKSVETTDGYLRRLEIETLARARHLEFMSYLLDEARNSNLKAVGNGFHCAPGEGTPVGCTRHDMCGAGEGGCPARRIVLKDPAVIAEWIACLSHIEEHADYLQENRPERWQAVWAPRMAEYRVLLEGVTETEKLAAQEYLDSVALMPLE